MRYLDTTNLEIAEGHQFLLKEHLDKAHLCAKRDAGELTINPLIERIKFHDNFYCYSDQGSTLRSGERIYDELITEINNSDYSEQDKAIMRGGLSTTHSLIDAFNERFPEATIPTETPELYADLIENGFDEMRLSRILHILEYLGEALEKIDYSIQERVTWTPHFPKKLYVKDGKCRLPKQVHDAFVKASNDFQKGDIAFYRNAMSLCSMYINIGTDGAPNIQNASSLPYRPTVFKNSTRELGTVTQVSYMRGNDIYGNGGKRFISVGMYTHEDHMKFRAEGGV